jgi:hypothetical protein
LRAQLLAQKGKKEKMPENPSLAESETEDAQQPQPASPLQRLNAPFERMFAAEI